MNNKQVKCKNCGEEISIKATVCPNCGVKNKKPFYKRAWFIILAIIVVVGVISSISGEDNANTTVNNAENKIDQAEIVYTEYEVSQLVNDLEENALRAEEKYKNQYVKITGELSNIDSDGRYISLSPTDNSFSFINVQCFIKNDEQKSQIAQMNKGDIVVVKGKIKSIGELLGYQLDIDSFE